MFSFLLLSNTLQLHLIITVYIRDSINIFSSYICFVYIRFCKNKSKQFEICASICKFCFFYILFMILVFFSFVFGYSIYRYAKPRFLLNKSCCLRLSLRSISKLFLLGISILPVCVCVCFCVRNFRHRSVLQRNNYALSWYVASSTDPIFLHTKLLN